MAYDFKQRLRELEQAREKSETAADLTRVVSRFQAFKMVAVAERKTVEFVNGLIHEAITYMHLYERTESPLFLASYFGCVTTAWVVVETSGLLTHNVAVQVQKRMADYFYEVGDHMQSLSWYIAARDSMPGKNSAQEAEFLAPMGRAIILAYPDSHAKAFEKLDRAAALVNQHKKDLEPWHWMIVKSGVNMKRAEALVARAKANPRNREIAKRHMHYALKWAQELDRLGYPQRLIQVARLNRKLGLVCER